MKFFGSLQVHFDPKAIDLGKAKAFPLRDQHFFTSIEKVTLPPQAYPSMHPPGARFPAGRTLMLGGRCLAPTFSAEAVVPYK